jgi:hypothetical protein
MCCGFWVPSFASLRESLLIIWQSFKWQTVSVVYGTRKFITVFTKPGIEPYSEIVEPSSHPYTLFLRHRVQTGSGAHPASYKVGTGGSFPGGKSVGARGWLITSI